MLRNDGTRHVPPGRFLRAFNLDELLQLWNVLGGDMTFVGPRPRLVDHLPLRSHERARRIKVWLGMAGLAQAEGWNSLSWEEKLLLDFKYVDNRGRAIDASIVVKSFLVTVRMDRVNLRNQEVVRTLNGQESTI